MWEADAMKTIFWLTVISLFAFFSGSAEVLAESKDHPVIKPVPGSSASSEPDYKRFHAYTFRYKENGKQIEKTVKGQYWGLNYKYFKENGEIDKSVSALETIENFKQAAMERNASILAESNSELIFVLPMSDGSNIWTRVYCNNWSGYYQLFIVEEEGFKKSLTFGAEEIKKQLDEKGHVAIYGILFDTDKASLKPESEKPLQEIVKLMQDYPTLKLELQGHTDNQGSKDYNLELSQRRAETVQAYLVASGINDSRLAAKGYGLSQPVATNDTEEGRAKNRRVELVKKETLETSQVGIKRSGDKQPADVSDTDFAGLVDAADRSNSMGDRIGAVENLKKAILSIWDDVPLAARNIRLVSDLKNYTSKKDNIYRQGETIYITSQLLGHTLKRIGDGYHINITTDFLVLDETGKVLGGQEEVYKFDHTSPIPNTEFSLDLTYTLTGLPGGVYKIQTKINDKNSAKSTSFENIIEIR
jgi:outer membrane protein OmpA-like peptidoglycan-associated protein